MLRIIQQEAVAPGPRFDHLFQRYIDPVRIFGSELLKRLRESGRVRTDDVSLLYFFMTNGAGGPLSHPAIAERFGVSVDPNDPEAVRAHANAAADLLFDGLLTDPGPASPSGPRARAAGARAAGAAARPPAPPGRTPRWR